MPEATPLRPRPELAIVLAAGKGTRMGHPTLPKPLVPVGGRPMLDRVLDGLDRAGLGRVVLVVGHHADAVEAHVGARHGATDVRYVCQERQDGTADAVACAFASLTDDAAACTAALVCWADILVSPAHYDLLATSWTLRDVVALTTVLQGNPSAGALVSFDAALRMTAFEEKPVGVTRGWADGGVSVHSVESLSEMATVQPSPRGEKEIATVLQGLLRRGRPIGVEKLAGPWMDLGTPAAIAEAERRYPELLGP